MRRIQASAAIVFRDAQLRAQGQRQAIASCLRRHRYRYPCHVRRGHGMRGGQAHKRSARPWPAARASRRASWRPMRNSRPPREGGDFRACGLLSGGVLAEPQHTAKSCNHSGWTGMNASGSRSCILRQFSLHTLGYRYYWYR